MVFGLYGMNFKYMPELKWRIGYPLVVVVVLLICAWLYRLFKRSGWL
jgi:magnesium transporter